MAGLKKKNVVLLSTIALGSSLLLLISAQNDNSATELKNSNIAQYQPQIGTLSGSVFANDSTLSQTSSYDSSYPADLFFRAIIAVLFVVVLGVAAVYASKKLLPKITNLPGKEIRIIETIHLGPRRSVHLLEIGSRRLLIGSTNENINTLLDFNSIPENLSAQEIEY